MNYCLAAADFSMRGFALLWLALLLNSASAAPLTDAEIRGKQIYLTGTGWSGRAISARVGVDQVELDGAQLPCANCHGEDGQGLPEGGIVPSNIRFEHLALSYGHRHDDGRQHPAFTDDSIIRAITDGIDPAGNRLDYAMPRFALSDQDGSDLLAYLKRLSTDSEAGITDTTIRLGTLLPLQGALADMGLAVKDLLTAYFNEINGRGGIYNRKFQLEVAEFTGNKNSTLKNAGRLLQSEPVFTLLAPFAGTLEQDVLALTDSQGVPQIGPYTLFPEDDAAGNRLAFYLLPGLNHESRAMVDYAVDRLGLKDTHTMVISPDSANLQKAIAAVEQHSRTRGLGAVSKAVYPADRFQPQALLAQLQTKSPAAIFFFGSGDELHSLLKSAEILAVRPYVFISGSLTGSKVFNDAFRDRIFLSFPPLLHNQTAAEEFYRLINRNKLPKHHLVAQAVAYSAAKLLVEGLQRTGRDLSRKKLVAALESIYQFDTGLTPALSFAPNRRVGSVEVAIVGAPAK